MQRNSINLLFFLGTFLFALNAQAGQSCVEQRIAEFRAHHGPDEPIRYDILEEWEEDCSNENSHYGSVDVEVSISSNPYYGTLVFEIQAIEDSVVIRDVEINRGNCELPAGTAAEIRRDVFLFFGDFYRGYSNNCSVNNVREIKVVTDSGEFVFDFSHR